MTDARWPVVAGIPLVVCGEGTEQLSHWLLDGWCDSAAEHAPLVLEYIEGDTSTEALTRVASSADPAVGSYFVDERGELAVLAAATDGAPPQLMRTVERGYRYAIHYERGQRAGALQWRWPRNVFTYAVTARRIGLVAHASAALLPDGRAILAPGVSGAGKSTLARAMRNIAGVHVLSDDRVAVVRAGNDTVKLFGTPWYSSAHAGTGAGGVAGAIVFPARGNGRSQLEPLRPADALRRLMRALAFPVWSASEMDDALALTSVLLAQAPAFELRWTPDECDAARLASLLDDAVNGTSPLAVIHG